MSYASLRRLRRPCCPCAPSVSPWTSPCSLFPVCKRAPCSPAFHFKYKTPPSFTQSSYPPRSVLSGNVSVCVCVFVQTLSPFFARWFSGFDLFVLWCHKADLQGASQGLSLLFLQMLISVLAEGISPSHVCCVIFALTDKQPQMKSGKKSVKYKRFSLSVLLCFSSLLKLFFLSVKA